MYFSGIFADKQQELDVPSFKIEDNEQQHKEKENVKHTGKARPMTQITGVRKLKHTNSFTGQVPKFGVETPHKEELGKVNNNFVCSILTGTTLLTQVQVYLYN